MKHFYIVFIERCDFMVENLIVKETEFKGNVIKQLFVVIDKKEFLIGTLKEKTDYGYINCVHKEFKESK